MANTYDSFGAKERAEATATRNISTEERTFEESYAAATEHKTYISTLQEIERKKKLPLLVEYVKGFNNPEGDITSQVIGVIRNDTRFREFFEDISDGAIKAILVNALSYEPRLGGMKKAA